MEGPRAATTPACVGDRVPCVQGTVLWGTLEHSCSKKHGLCLSGTDGPQLFVAGNDCRPLIRSFENRPRMRKLRQFIHQDLANGTSILKMLPLCLLAQEGGYRFLIPLMILNNLMDGRDVNSGAVLNSNS